MQQCPKMKAVIEALSAKHHIDLQRVGTHFRLDLPGYDRLCVERIAAQRISVAHYFEANGDLVAEPDVVFLISAKGEWFPIEITQSLTGYTKYVVLSADGTAIRSYLPHGQRDLADFVEQWAENIETQGWLERGVTA